MYCTGSEDEEDADDGDDSSSVSSSDNNIHEVESNTTHQTVIDSNQMRLHHQRVDGKDQLPRRLLPQSDGNAAKLSSSKKEDLTESKQMLFNRYIGAADPNRHPFTRPQKFAYRKDPSDDCLSSTYPNSSHSTMRDLTCSSISSAIASSSAVNEDLDESGWPAQDTATTTTFSLNVPAHYPDTRPQHQMESMWTMSSQWRSPEKERKLLLKQQRVHDDKYYLDEELEQFDSNESSLSMRDTNDVSPLTSSKFTVPQQKFTHRLHVTPAQPSTVDPFNRNAVYSTPHRILFSQLSLTQSTTSVGMADHWTRAKRFGDVIRRTGHHFGPVRNPDCQCSHCRRWIAERDQGRKRASSVGDVSPFIHNGGAGSWQFRHRAV